MFKYLSGFVAGPLKIKGSICVPKSDVPVYMDVQLLTYIATNPSTPPTSAPGSVVGNHTHTWTQSPHFLHASPFIRSSPTPNPSYRRRLTVRSHGNKRGVETLASGFNLSDIYIKEEYVMEGRPAIEN